MVKVGILKIIPLDNLAKPALEAVKRRFIEKKRVYFYPFEEII